MSRRFGSCAVATLIGKTLAIETLVSAVATAIPKGD